MNSQNDKPEHETAPEALDAADADGEATAGETEDRGADEPQGVDDAIAEAVAATVAEGAPADDDSPWLQAPEARIAELEEQVATLKDQFLRAMAEAENVRKRSERQLAEAHKYGVANFARAVLTIADDLSRALDAVPEDQRPGDGLLQTLHGGVEAVERELVKVLEEHNIERIDPAGEPFDPNFHEAMFEVPDSEYPSGTVAHVVQPGYRLHDRLLRPARVGVAKDKDEPAAPHIDTTV
jgi:molecular chaperone GrpE